MFRRALTSAPLPGDGLCMCGVGYEGLQETPAPKENPKKSKIRKLDERVHEHDAIANSKNDELDTKK